MKTKMGKIMVENAQQRQSKQKRLIPKEEEFTYRRWCRTLTSTLTVQTPEITQRIFSPS